MLCLYGYNRLSMLFIPQAIARMNEEFKVEKASGTRGIADYDELAIEFMKLDLNSFKSVVEFTEAYKRSGRPLHVLFCNAGIALRPFGEYPLSSNRTGNT